MNTVAANPSGVCMCGCGQPVPLAVKTDRRKGLKKGEPVRYLAGHQTRYHELPIDKIDVGMETPCWIWQAATNSVGYAIRGLGTGEKWLVHRRLYEDRHGPLDRWMLLHHRCETPPCVNPDHLEAVTSLEHAARHRKTHCKRGHEFTPENTLVARSGKRRCRICKRAENRRAGVSSRGAAKPT